MPVETNIVIVQVQTGLTSPQVMGALAEVDIRCFTFGDDKLRLVTHLDFNDDHLRAFEERVKKITMAGLEISANTNSGRLAGSY